MNPPAFLLLSLSIPRTPARRVCIHSLLLCQLAGPGRDLSVLEEWVGWVGCVGVCRCI